MILRRHKRLKSKRLPRHSHLLLSSVWSNGGNSVSMTLRRFQVLSICCFGHKSRGVHCLVLNLRHAHWYLSYRASTICGWTFEHRIISNIMIPWKYRLLTRSCNIKVRFLRLAHLLEIVTSGIHAHFVATKTYNAASLNHHITLRLWILVPVVIWVLLTRKIQMHHLLLIHHAVIIKLILVCNISLQVFDTVSAPHNAVLKLICRLLGHGSLTIVDYVTWRSQNRTFSTI